MLNQVLASINLPGKVDITQVQSLSFNSCYVLHGVQRDDDFFLKILAPIRPMEDRAQEFAIQRLASTAQLSPTLLKAHHDIHSTWMLFEFISASCIAKVQQILPCLRAFHQLPFDDRIKKNDPLQLARYYLDEALGIKPEAPLLKKLQIALGQLSLPEIQTWGLCHFDVHPGNFLVDQDKTFIIDFENSGVFDSLYDLAVLGFYLALDTQALRSLLASYMPFNEIAFQKILHYKNICLHLFFCFLAYRLLVAHGELPIPVPQQDAEAFSVLIRNYWSIKTLEAQKKLELDLFRFGFGLLGI